MDKISLAKLLGLRLRYDYTTEEYVQKEIEDYPNIGADVEFIFDSEDSRYDEAFTFEVSTQVGLEDAYEKAADVVIEGLQSAIITGIKLR